MQTNDKESFRRLTQTSHEFPPTQHSPERDSVMKKLALLTLAAAGFALLFSASSASAGVIRTGGFAGARAYCGPVGRPVGFCGPRYCAPRYCAPLCQPICYPQPICTVPVQPVCEVPVQPVCEVPVAQPVCEVPVQPVYTTPICTPIYTQIYKPNCYPVCKPHCAPLYKNFAPRYTAFRGGIRK